MAKGRQKRFGEGVRSFWLCILILTGINGSGCGKSEAELCAERAKLGDREAQHDLGGQLLFESETNLDKMAVQGRSLLEASAAQGYVDSIYLLGLANWYGIGSKADQVAGMNLLVKAAFKGHRKAQYAYGLALLEKNSASDEIDGRIHFEVEKNTQAITWLRKAAENGETRAYIVLGDIEHDRHWLYGVPDGWIRAAKMNDAWAVGRLAHLYSHPHMEWCHHCACSTEFGEKAGNYWYEKAVALATFNHDQRLLQWLKEDYAKTQCFLCTAAEFRRNAKVNLPKP